MFLLFCRQRTLLWCWPMRAREKRMNAAWMRWVHVEKDLINLLCEPKLSSPLVVRWPTMWSKLCSIRRYHQTPLSSDIFTGNFVFLNLSSVLWAGSEGGVHQAEDVGVWPGETEPSSLWAFSAEAAQPAHGSLPGNSVLRDTQRGWSHRHFKTLKIIQCKVLERWSCTLSLQSNKISCSL